MLLRAGLQIMSVRPAGSGASGVIDCRRNVMKRVTGIAGMMLFLVGVLFMSTAAQAAAAGTEKPVIALIAFGTSVPEAQKSFEEIDNIFSRTFPEYEIRWAFTAQFIIDKLAREGQTTMFARKEKIVNPGQLFQELAAAGHKEIWVQSLHVVPGGEYNELVNSVIPGLKINFGAPLLSTDKDIENVAQSLARKFGDSDTYTILAGHGNDHHAALNEQLIKFNNYLLENYQNVRLATVEGPVGTESAFDAVKKSGLKKVRFIPLMIVAGDHIMNDVMGDEDDSWKKTLNLQVSVELPLGQDPVIIEIFRSHLNDILPQ